MKTYFKTFGRMMKHHAARLVSVILMVLISIAFCAGIGMAKDKIDRALDEYRAAQNVSDLTVKCTSESGFSKEEKALLSERYGDNVMFASSFEIRNEAFSYGGIDVRFEGVGEGITKLYLFDMGASDVTMNLPETLETFETEFDAVYYSERATKQLRGFSDEDVLTLKVDLLGVDVPFSHAGTLLCPLHFALYDDPSLQYEGEELSAIVYLYNFSLLPVSTDAYITVPTEHELFSNGYDEDVEREKDFLGEALPDAVVLTLHENFSFASFHEFGGKIESIGFVMTVVFLLVTLLVVNSTATRMLEEERSQVACLLTIGYSPMRILSKYLLFALIGTAIGSAGAYFSAAGLAYILYINFDWNFTLPPYPAGLEPVFHIVVSALICVSALLATLFAGLKMTSETPAELLRPKSPKPGKKVFFEKIPFLWNRFSFKYKSTLRNILRFKPRFAMTVVAVACSTALVLAGLSVLDCCLFQDIGTAAMLGVGVIVVIFSALLNFVVIYTLANINISERNRELATLMVLGYQNGEVAMYIYREIYITSAIGILFGIPLGVLLCVFLFDAMSFGSLAAMGWYCYLLAPLFSLLFTFLSTLILRRKIITIDMNESLKAVE